MMGIPEVPAPLKSVALCLAVFELAGRRGRADIFVIGIGLPCWVWGRSLPPPARRLPLAASRKSAPLFPVLLLFSIPLYCHFPEILTPGGNDEKTEMNFGQKQRMDISYETVKM